MKLKIAGVDPSMRNFGVVLGSLDTDTLKVTITDMHLFQTENEASKQVRKSSDDFRRAKLIHDGLVSVLKGVSIAFVEMPIGSQDAQAMKGYGMSIMACSAIPCPVVEVSPKEAKEAAVGVATATKSEMIDWAMNKHPEASWLMRKLKGEMVPLASNEHLADACAAIQAGMKTEQFKTSLALFRTLDQSLVS